MKSKFAGITAWLVTKTGWPFWVVSALKYAVLVAGVGGFLWVYKADYDAAKIKEGYDECRDNQVTASLDLQKLHQSLLLKTEEIIDEGERQVDTNDSVSIGEYRRLERDYYRQQNNFERQLDEARRNAKPDINGCPDPINEPMPEWLQRDIQTQ